MRENDEKKEEIKIISVQVKATGENETLECQRKDDRRNSLESVRGP